MGKLVSSLFVGLFALAPPHPVDVSLEISVVDQLGKARVAGFLVGTVVTHILKTAGDHA